MKESFTGHGGLNKSLIGAVSTTEKVITYGSSSQLIRLNKMRKNQHVQSLS